MISSGIDSRQYLGVFDELLRMLPIFFKEIRRDLEQLRAHFEVETDQSFVKTGLSKPSEEPENLQAVFQSKSRGGLKMRYFDL